MQSLLNHSYGIASESRSKPGKLPPKRESWMNQGKFFGTDFARSESREAVPKRGGRVRSNLSGWKKSSETFPKKNMDDHLAYGSLYFLLFPK